MKRRDLSCPEASPMLPPSDDGPLMALALAADADLSDAAVGGALLRISDLAPAARAFTWMPLEGGHPLEVLMGFRAPLHWRLIGVSCTGEARHVRRARRSPGTLPEGDAVTVTLLVDRDGDAACVVRKGDEVTPMPGRPEGTVADACRRALDLPTAPPPRSTLGLWTLAWLDRLVDVASRADAASRLATWAQVAELHAAVGPLTREVAGASGPAALAASARALAEAWTWARLRADPAVVELPDRRPSPQLAAWMDDGMWARWLLSRLPDRADLLAAVRALLPARLAEGVDVVAQAAWGRP
jgi:hypothetical protein